MVAVHNHLVLEQNRGTAKTVHARKRPGTNKPLLVSLEIVRRHDHFLPVQEGDIDLLAVRRRRAGGITVE